ncbi:phage major capsid protein, HK97 family [compost metagenome]
MAAQLSVAEEYALVRADLKTVGSELREYAEQTEREQKEISARLSHLEQHVVKLDGSGGFGGGYTSGASIGALALEKVQDEAAGAFAALAEWNAGTCRVKLQAGIRAALTNEGMGGSSDTSVPRQPEQRGFVAEVTRPLRLLDALPRRPTSRDSVQFVQLNSTGDAAEQQREGDEKAEIDVEGTPKAANIATVAAHTTASRQVLGDHPALQAAIDLMVRNKLLARLEYQLVNGLGGEGKIDGLLNQATTFIPTIGTTPADIIGESLTRQAENGYLPNLVVMNPMDWFRLQITKKNATDEEYVFGSPTMPVAPSLWNSRIVTTPSIAEGEAMTIDTSFVTVLDREAPGVLLSNSHKDYFTRNLLLILGELRAGLEVLDTFAIYKMSLLHS